jgi:hypothetical protein
VCRPIVHTTCPVKCSRGNSIIGDMAAGGCAQERSILRQLDHPLIVNGLGTAAGESKRLVVESPWSQFISTCQRD